jgi:hypothetical protein
VPASIRALVEHADSLVLIIISVTDSCKVPARLLEGVVMGTVRVAKWMAEMDHCV